MISLESCLKRSIMINSDSIPKHFNSSRLWTRYRKRTFDSKPEFLFWRRKKIKWISIFNHQHKAESNCIPTRLQIRKTSWLEIWKKWLEMQKMKINTLNNKMPKSKKPSSIQGLTSSKFKGKCYRKKIKN